MSSVRMRYRAMPVVSVEVDVNPPKHPLLRAKHQHSSGWGEQVATSTSLPIIPLNWTGLTTCHRKTPSARLMMSFARSGNWSRPTITTATRSDPTRARTVASEAQLNGQRRAEAQESDAQKFQQTIGRASHDITSVKTRANTSQAQESSSQKKPQHESRIGQEPESKRQTDAREEPVCSPDMASIPAAAAPLLCTYAARPDPVSSQTKV
ncbi:hypothetical protein BP6252_01727 [Coleophoma cylindrospora]|uniref:Uncharacterized protein n=1 Tax=Coleophoma cylindrospora TaxID=1849047 RepID=A0A3D8STT1_9HELO|nr:hypothetical protein BP6252_01727 [Coleophoma cylindrospora]